MDSRSTLSRKPVQLEYIFEVLTFIVQIMKQFDEQEVVCPAIEYIPLLRIRAEANAKLKRMERETGTPAEEGMREKLCLTYLCKWFHKEFFRFMENPYCHDCKMPMQVENTVRSASVRNSLASSVEIYSCLRCGTTDFLNRFIDARVLLITREGRCSEFAILFTLFCITIGFRARYVFDLTDHCWTEVFVEATEEWFHVDPTEGIVDMPMMYEEKWKKKISYVFACGVSEIQDVTWRYVSDMKSTLKRRIPEYEPLIIKELIRIRKFLYDVRVPESNRKNELRLVAKELADLCCMHMRIKD